MQDPKSEVIGQLLSLARMIRRKGNPDEAAEALPYERLLAKDLADRQRELTKQPALPAMQPKEEEVHA